MSDTASTAPSTETVLGALQAAELTIVKTTDTHATVRVMTGIRARSADIPLALPAAAEHLSGLPLRVALASFARGVYAALAEPKRSKSEDMTFVEAARTILPSLEGPLFADGVAAAGGDTPHLDAFGGDIVIAYQIELDLGVRLLSKDQVAAWGATGDRVEKAAMSILFHRSWGRDFVAEPDTTFERFDGGDGHDAARALMLDQSAYDRVRDGLLFAVPTPDTLLISADTGDASVMALAAYAASVAEAASSPLTPSVYAFERGRRQREPRRAG